MDFKNLPVHPAAEIFPMMSDADFSEFKEDIRKTEVRDSIVLYDGQLLDGRNRLKAMLELGLDPHCHYSWIDKADDFDPVAYVLSVNLHRRHLTTSQRAMVAARCRKAFDVEASDRKRETEGRPAKDKPVANSPPVSKSKSRDKAGKALKVGGKSVDAATKILKSNKPELIAKVDSGEMSLNAAVKAVEPAKSKKVSKTATQVAANQVVESVAAKPDAVPVAVPAVTETVEDSPGVVQPVVEQPAANEFEVKLRAYFEDCTPSMQAVVKEFVATCFEVCPNDKATLDAMRFWYEWTTGISFEH